MDSESIRNCSQSIRHKIEKLPAPPQMLYDMEGLSQISFLARKPDRTRIRIHFPHSGRLVANRDITRVSQCQ
jgi:hypothetical protein